MNGYNFTERVRKVLAMAREEASRLHHEYVGTEHILLGLIREGEGVAATVLQNLNVDLDEIQQKIEETVKKGKAPQASDLPYTSRAKKVLELAMAEARDLSHSYVGTEHLLLGLLRGELGDPHPGEGLPCPQRIALAFRCSRNRGIGAAFGRAETGASGESRGGEDRAHCGQSVRLAGPAKSCHFV